MIAVRTAIAHVLIGAAVTITAITFVLFIPLALWLLPADEADALKKEMIP